MRATAAQLVREGHYATVQIEARLAEVNAVWDALMSGATDKEKMLTEAGKVPRDVLRRPSQPIFIPKPPHQPSYVPEQPSNDPC